MRSIIRQAIVLVILQGLSALDMPRQQNSLGAWKMMNQAAPVKFRGTISAILSGNKIIVWGGETGGDANEQPASDGAIFEFSR